jgi:hypothetical protein
METKKKCGCVSSSALAVAHFVKDTVKIVHSGFKVGSELRILKRLDICETCPSRAGKRCGVCGCFIKLRAAMDIMECPLGNWARESV